MLFMHLAIPSVYATDKKPTPAEIQEAKKIMESCLATLKKPSLENIQVPLTDIVDYERAAKTETRQPTRIRIPKQFRMAEDKALELEQDFTPQLSRKWVTTSDGKVSGLFLNSKEPFPSRFLDFLAVNPELNTRYPDPRQIPWDLIPHAVQKALIGDLMAQRGRNRFEDLSVGGGRAIHGLKIRDFLDIELSEPSVVFGQRLPAGSHRIDMRRWIKKHTWSMALQTRLKNLRSFQKSSCISEDPLIQANLPKLLVC
jgi:hypothetical protein